MNILVNVKNQKLKIATNLKTLVAGSQEFVRFEFILGDEWDGLTVFAQFRQNDTAYNQYLDEDNAVYLPSEIVAGKCTLMLYGTGDTVIGTTNYVTLAIDDNILIADANSTEVSESLYSQLVDQIADLLAAQADMEAATTAATEAATSANAAAETATAAAELINDSGLVTSVDEAIEKAEAATAAAAEAVEAANAAAETATAAAESVAELTAENVSYDSSENWLDDKNVQGAIDTLALSTVNAEDISSWAEVQEIVRAGVADKVFQVRDQFQCKRNGTIQTWDIVGFDVDTPADSNYTHSMTLALHDCYLGFSGWQFDGEEALFAVNNALLGGSLPAGTYYFKVLNGGFVADVNSAFEPEYHNTDEDGLYQFTTTVDIPYGGVIVHNTIGQARDEYSKDYITGERITTYASPESTEPLEENIVVTEVSGDDTYSTMTGVYFELFDIEYAIQADSTKFACSTMDVGSVSYGNFVNGNMTINEMNSNGATIESSAEDAGVRYKFYIPFDFWTDLTADAVDAAGFYTIALSMNASQLADGKGATEFYWDNFGLYREDANVVTVVLEDCDGFGTTSKTKYASNSNNGTAVPTLYSSISSNPVPGDTDMGIVTTRTATSTTSQWWFGVSLSVYLKPYLGTTTAHFEDYIDERGYACVNYTSRAACGSNNYLTSSIRQFINAEEKGNAWWEPQTDFDRPSVNVTSDGFLWKMDSDFLAVLGKVKKQIALSDVDSSSNITTSNELFFLPSGSEVFGDEWPLTTDGEQYKYFETESNRIKYDDGEAANWYLRSPSKGFPRNVFHVTPEGEYSNYFALQNVNRCITPCCCVV